MITDNQLSKAGIFTKTHGIHGELNATLDIPAEFFEENDFFVCYLEGIPTPFFIESFRPKGNSSSLIKPEGVASELEVKIFVGKEFFVFKKELKEFLEENDSEEGEYASDLIGWTIEDAESLEEIGEIIDVNLSTANPLFIVKSKIEENMIMIPIAEEFMQEIIEEEKKLIMNLPEGLIDLNNK